MGKLCTSTRMLALGNAVLPIALSIASLTFLAFGSIFVAPFWLADGVTFLVSAILAWPAKIFWTRGDTRYVACSVAVCGVAAFSILMGVAFLIAAVILLTEEMNPIARTSYGRTGDSFIVCSCVSVTLNTLSLVHFIRLARTPLRDESTKGVAPSNDP